MIRLFIIEDHPIIVNGFRNMFRPDREGIEVVCHACCIREAVEKATMESFDILLLDLWLPGTDPVENLVALTGHFPGKPVLIFTSEQSSLWQQKMLSSGAHGYLVKSASKYEIREVLERLHRGQKMNPEYGTGSIDRPVNEKTQGTFNQFQREMLLLLAKGQSINEIAQKQGISVSTLEKKIRQIREKYQAANNVALIRYLTLHNLI